MVMMMMRVREMLRTKLSWQKEEKKQTDSLVVR